MFGVDLPIIQAPMAGVQDSALAIAVSTAGALGSLPCAMLSAEQIAAELRTIKQATVQPINLNFFCHVMPPYDEERQAKWRQLLRPYFEELDLAVPEDGVTAKRLPFTEEIADVIEPFQPEILSFHFGLPEQRLLRRIQGWNCKILATATTVAEGLWLEAQGVDAIIAQGLEAGGHRGLFLDSDLNSQQGTFLLLAQLLKRVKVPVIAAGGIADANSVAAVIRMGAMAAQVGTAYLLCNEARTSPLYRAALQSSDPQTAVTTVFSGRPARGIVNRLVKELGALPEDVAEFPYAGHEIALLRQAAEARGRNDFTSMWCGQNSSGCRAVPAAELTAALAEQLV